MALFNCPNCNKEISTKAKFCVNCGYEVTGNEIPKKKVPICPECGAPIENSDGVCSNCGFHMSNIYTKTKAAKKPKRASKKKWFWILAIGLILVVLVALYTLNNIRINNYNVNICTAVNEIMSASSEVESVGNKIGEVWHDATWGVENPDTEKYTATAEEAGEALDNLFADEEFAAKIEDARKRQKQIDRYLTNLKNPPSAFEDAHEAFKELYIAYSDYTDFVITHNGNYDTYVEEFSEKSTEILEKYRKIKVELLGD